MATTKCARLQAHSHRCWAHCGQQHERRNARRQADHAALSTLHAVCSCIVWRFHIIPHGSSRSHLSFIVIPSMDMRSVPWVFSLHHSLPLAVPLLLPPFPHDRRWLLWQSTTCATPRMGPSSPWTITSPSQVMSPTPWSSPTPRSSTTRSPATSSTSRIPSPTQSLRQTTTWMTTRSASYSQKYTEISPITAVRKV